MPISTATAKQPNGPSVCQAVSVTPANEMAGSTKRSQSVSGHCTICLLVHVSVALFSVCGTVSVCLWVSCSSAPNQCTLTHSLTHSFVNWHFQAVAVDSQCEFIIRHHLITNLLLLLLFALSLNIGVGSDDEATSAV